MGDITHRAIEVLGRVDLIAAEDTRQTRLLLQRYAIATKLVSLHEHNERRVAPSLVARIQNGESIALVSDAGTPLINDPGFELLSAAIEQGVSVVPVPGPCALITALSVSGLPTDRFSYHGFPPRASAARKAWFETLTENNETLIFYESCHRIHECLQDCAEVFPADRKLVIARELTKSHETILRTRVGEAVDSLREDETLRKGELVFLIEGSPGQSKDSVLTPEQLRIVEILLEECSVKKTAELASRITGQRKKLLYSAALELENNRS